MDWHPDSDTLRAFREHRLSGSVVTDVATHLGDCTHCAKAGPSSAKAALDALVPEEHLSDEQMDVLVDERREDSSYRAAVRHMTSCAMCRAEVEDLRRFDAAPAQRPSQPRWLKIAAAIVFAVLALSVIAIVVRRTTPDVPLTASNPPVPVATETVAPPAVRVVASLEDGTGRIELREDGTLSGVEAQPQDAEAARTVLSGRAIAIPTFITAMPGAVRGDDESTHPLRAIEPFRSAVLDARPRFSWRPLRDAKSYRVAVFDADYEEIARSEPLTSTTWTPKKALPAGQDLSWHVVAETEAGEVSSAGSNRGEAVFRVLSEKDASEIDRAKTQYRDSHLLRGLLYSRHGLLHDAEREFKTLADQNPDSPIARALLKSVSR